MWSLKVSSCKYQCTWLLSEYIVLYRHHACSQEDIVARKGKLQLRPWFWPPIFNTQMHANLHNYFVGIQRQRSFGNLRISIIHISRFQISGWTWNTTYKITCRGLLLPHQVLKCCYNNGSCICIIRNYICWWEAMDDASFQKSTGLDGIQWREFSVSNGKKAFIRQPKHLNTRQRWWWIHENWTNRRFIWWS